MGSAVPAASSALAHAASQAAVAPGKTVLFLVVELCALSFRRDDWSKSNIVATALFGDGAAAALLSTDGEGPAMVAAGEHTWPGSLDVMGWDVADDGLKAIFSRDIPKLVTTQLRDAASEFLARHGLAIDDIDRFVCHPGGAKVITALEHAFGLGTRRSGRGAGSAARLRQHVGDDRDVCARTDARQGARYRGTVGARADECARAGLHRRLSRPRQPVTALYWTLGLVALQRLIELAHARSNTARLRRLGAVEADAGGYPLYVLLHAGWLMSLAVFVPAATPPDWPLIGVFAAAPAGPDLGDREPGPLLDDAHHHLA